MNADGRGHGRCSGRARFIPGAVAAPQPTTYSRPGRSLGRRLAGQVPRPHFMLKFIDKFQQSLYYGRMAEKRPNTRVLTTRRQMAALASPVRLELVGELK